MLYRALRAAADIALHWHYAGVVVQGAERIPADGAVLVAANHPNALVDALVVATAVRRRVRLTAKATLFEHPLLAPLLRAVGVVPLRRAKDELAVRREAGVAPARNTESFRQVTEALRDGGVVLIFPEGISHDLPALAPLKTGAARMALAAAVAGARGVRVLPIGLIFERKERPRSRVLVRVGEPIDVDGWLARDGDVARLTSDLEAALEQLTLNFASEARAERAVTLARALAAITEAPPSLGQPRSLATEAELARRIEAATEGLEGAPPGVVQQADAFIARVEEFETRLRACGVSLTELRISPRLRHGARFVAREGALTAFILPVALLGRIVHWLPLRLARALAMRPLVADPSRDQPAMRTIVLGLAFVLSWYLLQALVVGWWLGAPTATAWLVLLFVAGRLDFVLRDRLHRAWRRARTYLALRGNPALREEALADVDALVSEALALETALIASLAVHR
jgi:1-acyl-sn-glycerol-3-phosphate acyltransferase